MLPHMACNLLYLWYITRTIAERQADGGNMTDAIQWKFTREQCQYNQGCYYHMTDYEADPANTPEPIYATVADPAYDYPLRQFLHSIGVPIDAVEPVSELVMQAGVVAAWIFGIWLAWGILGYPLRAYWRKQKEEEEKRLKEEWSVHGSARLATLHDYKQEGLVSDNKDGFLIGHAGKGWDFAEIRYSGGGHILTFAPTGSGKGVSAVVPNLLDYDGSVICIDPKGENAAITARYRREIGQEVHLLDPWGLAEQGCSSFNPFDWLDGDAENLTDDAMMLADTLVMNDRPDHWQQEATALIAGVIMYIAAHEPDERRNLMRLNHLLSLPADKFAALLKAMQDSHIPAVKRTGARFAGKAPNEASGVLSSAQSHLHFLESPNIAKVLERSDFDLLDLKRKKLSLYLILPADKLKSHSRWLRLMISLTLAALTREKGGAKKPVLFLLDEFAALGELKMVETAMGLMRGYGVKLWPILQDLSQLRGSYPRSWESFVANAGVLQVFGTNDQGTAQYFSQMAGMAFGKTGRPLFMPDEIRQIDEANQLLFVQSMPPCKCGKAIYYSMDAFKGKFDKNPYRED